MPTSSVALEVDTKELLAGQNENIKVDSNVQDSQDLQQKKKQQHFSNQSPRRKNSNARSLNNNNNNNSTNVTSNNRRNHQGFQKRNNNNNNNETSSKPLLFKQSNQPKVNSNMSTNVLSHQQDTSKKSHKSYHRGGMFRTHNGNYQYELQSDSTSSAPPSLDNEFLTRQHQQQIHNNVNSPSDTHNNAPRKYSKNFLNDIGYKLASSPRPRDEMSLRIALGDNSYHFSHVAQFLGSQQPIMMPQQHQYQQYTYPRYQTQHLQLQRMQRNQQGSYTKMQYEQPQPQEQQPCNCPQTQLTHERNVQYCYQNSPSSNSSYANQSKRDFRYGDKNKNRQYNNHGYHNGNNHHHRGGYLEKSQSFNEDEARRNSRSYQVLSNAQLDNQTYRSLSPTPPSSSKSSSPGVQEKSLLETVETTDDSESIASNASSSVQGFFNEHNMKSPIDSISLSAPVLDAPEFRATSSNVSYWVNRGKLHTGHSVSAEEIHNLPRENHTFKRPGSVQGQKRLQILKQHNIKPYPEYLDIFEVHTEHCKSAEIQSVPANLLSKSQFDRISEQMWNKFAMHQQKTETYQKKIDIWRELHDSMRTLPMFNQMTYPKWGLFMVGSTISGFGSDKSDVDMCFVIKSYHPRHDQRSDAIMTLDSLRNHLETMRAPFTNFSLIQAKVPILRFNDHGVNKNSKKVEVDLNFNNCVGVRNTHLLCHYSQLDWRIRPLALVVKLWANFHSINDARNSTISSYSLVLMVIHFLQYAVKPAVLPCLHKLMPEKFNQLHDITTINMVEKCDLNWKSENHQSLGELFLRFLDYYTNFDYAKNAISVRTGGVLPIEVCKHTISLKNDPNHWQTLCIEEPFELTNTARSAYDAEVFKKIQEVFQYSFLSLNADRNLESVFTKPLFSVEQHQHSMNQMKYLTLSNGHTPALTSSEKKS